MEFWLEIWSFRCDWSDSFRTSVNDNNSKDKFLNVKCSLSFLESGLHYFELSKLSVHIKKHINNRHSTCVSCQSVLSRLVIEISWFPPPTYCRLDIPQTQQRCYAAIMFFLSLRLSFFSILCPHFAFFLSAESGFYLGFELFLKFLIFLVLFWFLHILPFCFF